MDPTLTSLRRWSQHSSGTEWGWIWFALTVELFIEGKSVKVVMFWVRLAPLGALGGYRLWKACEAGSL